MKCKFCELDKTLEEFLNQDYKRFSNICKVCWSWKAKEVKNASPPSRSLPRRKKYRPALISYFKMCPCMDCGIKYPPWVMHYDHRPGVDKKFNLSGVGKVKNVSILEILQEIKKCDVVCANCHLHRTFIRLTSTEAALNYEEDIMAMSFYGKSIEQIESEENEPSSEKTIKHRKTRESLGTGIPSPESRKVVWPSKEELEKMVWETPTWKLAPQLGVSDKAIWKWCKIYGISKPPRGYWAKKDKKQTD